MDFTTPVRGVAGVEVKDPTNGNAGTHARGAVVETSHRNAWCARSTTHKEEVDGSLADAAHVWTCKEETKDRSLKDHLSTGCLVYTVPSIPFAAVPTRRQVVVEMASFQCSFDRRASLQGTNEHDRTSSREAFLDHILFRRKRTFLGTFSSATS